MNVAVRLNGITKEYRIFSSSRARALDLFTRKRRGRPFVALSDVTVDFPRGEVIAVLGRNGSGKSTLLKIIAGVTAQTSGTVEVNGRVSAMLELTAGFDPELSGVENIRLQALSKGIPRAEIEVKMEEIIGFADIGEHIDQPVRTYSSGMKSRLGFAVSASVDPDILIVDEVLAVGDDVFKLRCIERMEQFRREGKTIIFVSHSLFTVKAFCTRGLWLDGGKVRASGDLGDVVMRYEDFLRTEKARQVKGGRAEKAEPPSAKRDIVATRGFRMLNGAGGETREFTAGEDIVFEFDYEVKRPMAKLTFCFTVRNAELIEVFMSDKRSETNVVNSAVGKHTVRVRLPEPRLLGGTYHLSGELWNNDAGFYVSYANKQPFTVAQDVFLGTGIARMDYEFSND